ncbi:MAG: sodium-translocating pyrophosphatase [Actinobacteria bacterium]|nr:MAG: sodium-translocating pyrophosphatase [Actinomycetota bacterium]
MSEGLMLALIVGLSVFGLGVAWWLAQWVLKRDTGNDAMRAVSDAIKEGAEAFMRRQFRTIIYLAVALGAVLFIGYAFLKPTGSMDPVSNKYLLAMGVTVSFIFGAVCSIIAGYVGMWISIRANIRTAAGTTRSVNDGLQVALRGGAVAGFMVVAMSLLGVAGLYYAVDLTMDIAKTQIPLLIVGYGFGASFVALFSQLGGGIYTKAADVGADLVGKVEAGIPEDDARNPAVVADLVGDNVGDCAGRGADLFESTAAENIGAMILGAVMAERVVAMYPTVSEQWVLGVMMFPLVARAFGILASFIGILCVKHKEGDNPMRALDRGFYVATALAVVGMAISSYWLLRIPEVPGAWWHFLLAGVVGVITAFLYLRITQYYTEHEFRPVRSIADASQTGPATNIIAGMAVGFESTAAPVVVISIAILAAFGLGQSSGFPEAGLFGTAVATMGMLSTAAYVLAMDTFGPIADNAGGIIEMSGQTEEVRRKADQLDAAGNTTKALTKGYAIGSAALAAFLLFSAYMDEVRSYGVELTTVDIAKPEIFTAALLGGMLVFLFSAWTIRAVGKAAVSVIQDVRDQFKEKPGIMEGTDKPDYGRTVDIVTRAALKEMVAPGLLATLMPIAVGITFRLIGPLFDMPNLGAEAVAAFLMVGTIAGILMALSLNNSGGSWDNAKKYIELGFAGGKGSDTHKASVSGDTVGDPFKDTAGPSLHVLIKLLATVTLVLAPLFINVT